MSRRGRRTTKELEGVSTADMTPSEYRRSDDDHDYEVELKGALYRVHGKHSAKAVAGRDGKIRRTD